jgi:hypothetical protein
MTERVPGLAVLFGDEALLESFTQDFLYQNLAPVNSCVSIMDLLHFATASIVRVGSGELTSFVASGVSGFCR